MEEKVEVVEGKNPKDAVILGPRIARLGMKEGKDGSPEVEATVHGLKPTAGVDLVSALGQDVKVATASGRSQVGRLRQIVFTAGKEDKPARVAIKVTGGRGMDTLIGNGLEIEAMQAALPLPCKDCGHGWNTKRPKKKPNGHRRETGKCFCGCAEMKG